MSLHMSHFEQLLLGAMVELLLAGFVLCPLALPLVKATEKV